jgi:UTP--glucose-1-phosphate uridylyltransferase
MIFVTGRNKRAIEDHFDTAYELESELEASGKAELLAVVRSLTPDDMFCSYVRQPRSLGLGHAVLCARHIVRDDPFAVLLADDLMTGAGSGPGVLSQMVEVFQQVQGSVLAVQEVPRDQVKRYGIVAGTPVGERLVKVTEMVEKPAPERAPSRLGVAGRYVLTPAVFDCIQNQPRGSGGEIQLTDGIAQLIGTEGVYAYLYQGKRYDCGSKDGFLEATVEFGLRHPEIGTAFRDYLKGMDLSS